MSADRNFIHIYAQPAWHDAAHIVGTPDALRVLAAALLKAADGSGRAAMIAMTSDGEGYDISVECVTGWDAMLDYPMPYTDDIAADRRTNVTVPGAWVYGGKP